MKFVKAAEGRVGKGRKHGMSVEGRGKNEKSKGHGGRGEERKWEGSGGGSRIE